MAKACSQASLVQWLFMVILALTKRIQELEAKLGENSSNSNRPPSSDSPYTKSGRKKSQTRAKKNPGGQPGHEGHQQKLLDPTEKQHIYPEKCPCGGTEFKDQGVFYTHQEIEFPEIELIVRHFLLHKARCTSCGRVHKPRVPKGHSTGFGPRFSALIALLSGDHGNSRETVQQFCLQILGLHLSTGAIQNIINRASKAILPHYMAIKDKAHQSPVNHADETPWYQARGVLKWLWVLCNSKVAYFMIQARRNKDPAPTCSKWVQG